MPTLGLVLNTQKVLMHVYTMILFYYQGFNIHIPLYCFTSNKQADDDINVIKVGISIKLDLEYSVLHKCPKAEHHQWL